MRLGVTDLIAEIAAVPGIRNISLTTNGVLLARMADALAASGLDRINISLDTLDANQYRMITRGGSIDNVLAGIDAALAADFNPVKINTVAVRRLNQDFLSFARMSLDRPLHMRFIEYMPVGSSSGADGSGWGPEDVISMQEIFAIINESARAQGLAPLEPIADGEGPLGFGPARYCRFPGALGTVGFISPLSNHFCSSCNRLRLTADGKLRPCLFSDVEYDIRAAARTGTDDDIAAVFRTAAENKPARHYDIQGTERKMSQIGG